MYFGIIGVKWYYGRVGSDGVDLCLYYVLWWILLFGIIGIVGLCVGGLFYCRVWIGVGKLVEVVGGRMKYGIIVCKFWIF